MANLIDQQDSDSFPTCIQLNDATTLSANVVVSGGRGFALHVSLSPLHRGRQAAGSPCSVRARR
ncbi:MAG: hypothetical protein WDO13_08530 [Verrucomicrobiota bacterium]